MGGGLVKRHETAALLAGKANEAARQLRNEQDPRRRALLERGVEVWTEQAEEAARLLTPAQWYRLAGTSVFCGLGSALFLVPSAVAGWADLSAPMVVGGLSFPAAVATVFWLAKGLVDDNNARKAGKDRTVQLAQLQVENAERAVLNRAGAR